MLNVTGVSALAMLCFAMSLVAGNFLSVSDYTKSSLKLQFFENSFVDPACAVLTVQNLLLAAAATCACQTNQKSMSAHDCLQLIHILSMPVFTAVCSTKNAARAAATSKGHTLVCSLL